MTDPPEIRAAWETTDGRRVTIRPIRPEDRQIEQEFVRGLSVQSKFFRFFSTIKELSPAMLDRLTNTNYPHEMAYIATIMDEGSEREIGVARYGPGESDGAAEFAVVVADRWQGQGLGAELLRHLLAGAKKAGVARFEGLVLKTNYNMLEFCRKLDFSVADYRDDPSIVRVIKDL